MEKKIAVLIPCYNEELTIKKVVHDFRDILPDADIYVYNNNSIDKTVEYAISEGAIVKNEYLQGKGNTVRAMFRDIDADVYVLVDGDDTYPADEVQKLIKPVLEGRADMVIGDRLSSTYYAENKRLFHGFGNNLVRKLVNFLFKAKIRDIMTGYRAFSKRFVKCMPVISGGFQIETEMTIFSLINHMSIIEMPITYRDRPEGSVSKLSTFSDGIKVLLTLFNLFKDNRPFLLFGSLSFLFLLCGLVVGVPTVRLYIGQDCVLLFSKTLISTLLLMLSLFLFAIGIILDAIKNAKQYLFITETNRIIEGMKEK